MVLFLMMASSSAFAASQAEVRLHGLSLRLLPASASAAGLNYRLEFSTDATGGGSNGELAPLPPGANTTHGSFYQLTGDVVFELVFGSIFVDVPDTLDGNANGVPDLFEVDQPLPSTETSGRFEDADQSGAVTATWSRAAKSRSGVCRLALDAYNLVFTNSFEVSEFNGILSYRNVAQETNVIATLSLAKATDATRTLSGVTEFTKVDADRLRLRAGTLRDEKGQLLAYPAVDEVDRNGAVYTSRLVFKDGDPNTSAEDYFSWTLRIHDANDVNNNGIPDLSDDGFARTPPSISLRLLTNGLSLNISGEIGKVHQVERTVRLTPAFWTVAATLTLTNDPQAVFLLRPTNRLTTTFWRVKTP